jgi:DNA-binding transcriptional LysR family regulator
METLANLESFVRSAESGSFSAAARRLALTPAAVSRNVAMLERNLGERFLQTVSGGLDSIQSAIADVTTTAGQPAGTLKLSTSPGLGRDYLLPLMPAFLERYPAVVLDWNLDNRQVDLIAEGYDLAIGGGFELTPGLVARELAPAHIIAVATPAYMQANLKGKAWPKHPAELADYDGVLMRSATTGRLRVWTMRNKQRKEATAELKMRLALNAPDAICRAVLMDMGIGFVAIPDALPYLENNQLVRVLPDWYVDAGPISVYFAGQRLLPAKTRAFVDYVTEVFKQARLAERFSAF